MYFANFPTEMVNVLIQLIGSDVENQISYLVDVACILERLINEKDAQIIDCRDIG